MGSEADVRGRALLHGDVDVHQAGGASRRRGRLDGREVLQVVQVLQAADDLGAVEHVADLERQLTAQHVLPRLDVAFNGDVFDVGAVALGDGDPHQDRSPLVVAGQFLIEAVEDVTILVIEVLHAREVGFDGLEVDRAVGAVAYERLQLFVVEHAVALESRARVLERPSLADVQGEAEQVLVALGVVLGAALDPVDGGVHVPVAPVVGDQAGEIPLKGAFGEQTSLQQCPFPCLHLAPQGACRGELVAHELDRDHGGADAFRDGDAHDDAVGCRVGDDRGLHPRADEPVRLVQVADRVQILIEPAGVQDRIRFRRDHVQNLPFPDPALALDDDVCDRRPLLHRQAHDDRRPLLVAIGGVRLEDLEQLRRVQRGLHLEVQLVLEGLPQIRVHDRPKLAFVDRVQADELHRSDRFSDEPFACLLLRLLRGTRHGGEQQGHRRQGAEDAPGRRACTHQ